MSGSTRSATTSLWRVFFLGKAISVRLSTETFAAHPPGYWASAPAFTIVLAHL